MATSADILGSSIKPVKVPARWARHYERLCAERDKLLERDCAAAESFQPKLDDLADAASQESQRSLSLVSATATYEMIKEVLDALRRIERGTYGICEITGEPISSERLNSIPWTRYSLEGQRELEDSGQTRRAALPSLQALATGEPGEPEAEPA
jgi:RNA polymerase-binding transcription factor DksA